ncbi:hypothetical protein [Vulcanisaeta distributa]|uniref:hypothetical protein n=1 Tax=Vulcanisaeta distributa TaxID=164451 RepID=UPI000A67755A|nr:hypothetical protein [Vulcanisaeta distributa]
MPRVVLVLIALIIILLIIIGILYSAYSSAEASISQENQRFLSMANNYYNVSSLLNAIISGTYIKSTAGYVGPTEPNLPTPPVEVYSYLVGAPKP